MVSWQRIGEILGGRANCMDKSKIPHVCFKVAYTSEGDLGDELSRRLESHLLPLFNSVEIIKRRIFPVWAINLSINKKSFTLCLTRSRYENGEWVLLVGPLDTPILSCRLGRPTQITSVPELKLISQNIHSLLATITGISAIRWYFEGGQVQSRAVNTPDELPWD